MFPSIIIWQKISRLSKNGFVGMGKIITKNACEKTMCLSFVTYFFSKFLLNQMIFNITPFYDDIVA